MADLSVAQIRSWLNARLARLGLATDGQSLTGRIVRNGSWITVGYGTEIILRFISSLIITRLLDPSAYGLMSTVSVFMVVVAMMSDLGLRQIVMTDQRGDDAEFLGIIWSIQLLRGFFLAGLLGVGAWVWYMMQSSGAIGPGSSYADPLLPQLLGVISFSLIASGFGSINEFRLARHLKQGEITRIEIVSRVLTTLSTIALAFWFRSVWGLAIAGVLGASIRSFGMLFFLPGPRMRFKLDFSEVGRILGKSRWIALASFMSVMVSSGDKLFIGYGFGLGLLGIYAVAFTLFDAFQALIGRINSSMGISVLKSLHDKSAVERAEAYYRFRRPAEIYCVVIGSGLAVFGETFFHFVYDARYAQGGSYLGLLGVGLILFPFALSANFLLSHQRFKFVFGMTVVSSLTFLAGMLTALHLESIQLAVLAVALHRLPEYLLYLLLPGTGVPFSWRRDGAIILIAAIMFALTLVL